MIEWNAEQVELLKKLWADGLTAAQIGKEFGTTRNAISGKLNRLDLYRNPEKPRVAGQKKPSSDARERGGNKALRISKARLPATPVNELTPISPVAPDPIKIMELEWHHCRAIVGGWGVDALYCGDRIVEGASWCPHHIRLFYSKEARRPRVA